jgi:predicted nucleotidyltransferase
MEGASQTIQTQLAILLEHGLAAIDIDLKHLPRGVAPEGFPLPKPVPGGYVESSKSGGLHYLLRFRTALDPSKAERVTGLGGYVDVFHGGILIVAPTHFEGTERGYEVLQDGGIPLFRTLREGLHASAPWLAAAWDVKWGRSIASPGAASPTLRLTRGAPPGDAVASPAADPADVEKALRALQEAPDILPGLPGRGPAPQRGRGPLHDRVPPGGLPQGTRLRQRGDVGHRKVLRAHEVAQGSEGRREVPNPRLGPAHDLASPTEGEVVRAEVRGMVQVGEARSTGLEMKRPEEGGPNPAVLREALRRIESVVHPQRVILFGSAARGEMHEDSDLDLLVVVKGPVDKGRLLDEIYENMVGAGGPVDVLLITPEELEEQKDNPGMIYGTVLEEGEVVYGG